MSTELSNRLAKALTLPLTERPAALVDLADDLAGSDTPADPDVVSGVIEGLLLAINGRLGSPRRRADMGVALGRLGDPRLREPRHDDYWADVMLEEGGSLQVACNPVTTAEFKAWIDAGGYADDANWSEEGLAWRDSGEDAGWAALAAKDDVAHLVVPNQPAVGVTWYEAEAYAHAHNARMLTSNERRWVVRGAEKRPYPWGAPFGDGHANTREEAIGRPTAVGLYPDDITPDGVRDLAGNVGEWLSNDAAGGQRMLHPGSWVRPSMAAWAKALELADPETRSADLGFRLAR